jgi:hypothetical protein
MTSGFAVLLGVALITGCKPAKPAGQAASDGRPTRGGASPGAGELAVTPPIAVGAADLYEDVTARAGIKFVHQFCDTRIANIIESNGAGAAILDYDNDGFVDVYLVNSGPLAGVTHEKPGTAREPNRLYRNRGDGTFEDVTQKAGVGGAGYGIGVAAADIDNDGFTDLYVVNIGRSILYRNRGNGTFEDITDKAGVANGHTGLGAAFLDVDGDGKLDLFVANYLTFDPNYNLYYNPDGYPGPLSYKSELNTLYRNRGDGTFEDISEKAGVRLPGHRAMSVCAFDFDKNGAADIYLCNDATPNMLLVNDGKGHFQESAVKLGVAFNALGEAAGSMTAAIGDCNGDLIPDILVSRFGYGSLYVGSPQKTFTDRMMASGLGALTAQYVGWGSNFLDYDNDGDLDAFVANGDAHYLVGWESLLLENTGDGKFVDVAAKGGAYFKTKLRGRGSVVLDYDNDGRMDILVTAIGDRPFLLHNRSASGNHWVTFDLQGTKSNRDGFGAQITVNAGGKSYYTEAHCPSAFLGQSDRRVHLGLGAAQAVAKVEIKWPSGAVQSVENLAVDRIHKLKEP